VCQTSKRIETGSINLRYKVKELTIDQIK